MELILEEDDVQYKLCVSETDYNRAMTDHAFAQSLLFHAKVTGSSISTVASNQSRVENLEPASDNLEQYLENDRHSWSHDETLCLIKSMEVHIEDENHPKKRKFIFENVANDLISNGFQVNATVCHNKWKNLMRSYKTAKDNMLKTGRGPTRFLFFSEMDGVLGEKPSSSATHTLESNNLQNLPDTLPPPEMSAMSSLSSSRSSTPTLTRSKEKKGSILQIKKEEFRRKHERHKEKMRLLEIRNKVEEQKVNLLQEILNKLNS
uniref:Myb/SANT-like DNA-binding domain-containing protein n=1 Tax=Photinus pyralis TaxID=7054 RepID=A0A1Y1K6X1_PHOPY